MTEQSKIPTPGKSTFERAEELFGGEGFSPAPVPKDLAPGKPLGKVSKPSPAPLAEPATQTPPAPQPAMPQAAEPQDVAPIAAAPIAAEPASPPVKPLRLAGPIHEVDREELQRHGLIQPEAQVTRLLEEFRIVKRDILSAIRKARESGDAEVARRILICSPLPNEGKSFCAVNLALALAAEKDSEVVLVDADFAKPSILSMLGLPRGTGLMDVLANPKVQLEDCILSTDISGLHVLPAGSHTNSDSEFLTSSRTKDVLARLTAGAPNRIVIFDSPPALAASPAAELANHVGQALVVARADRTGQSALEDALTLLSACPDIKLVLNAAHFSPSGRRFGAYYGQEA